MPVGFTFDQAKCTGCQACILACTIENGLAFDNSWRTVYTFNEHHHHDLPVSHLSLACNHCAAPACLSACPSKAYSKDAVTGFVVLDESKCLGCRYCTWACPFGAPDFDEDRGVVSKCDFCNERQATGMAPACVASCPTGALGIGGQPAPGTQKPVPGFPATGLGPAIHIEPAADKRHAPECSASPPSQPYTPPGWAPAPRSALTSEWPLAAFTFLTALLVALVTASAFTGQPVSVFVFLAIATSAALLSTAHLGRRVRAWRALLNPTQSWLSREILLFSLLVGAGTWYLTVASDSRIVGSLAIAIGLGTLVSIDRVYGTLPLVDRRHLHSAGAFLTGLLLTAVFLDNPLFAGIVGGAKLFLYVQRKAEFHRTGRPARPELVATRMVFGFLVPGVLWSLTGVSTHVFVIAPVLLGELVDRLEFYLELEVVTPERQMVLDLRKAISVGRR